jgi:hypothetical protein
LKVDGQELTVRETSREAGAVVIVRHGDGTTTSFNIIAVRQRDGSTILKTREAPTLTVHPKGFDSAFFPKTMHPGPHEVQFVTRAARRIETKG